MPHLYAHMAIAYEAARCSPHAVLDAHLGAYLLGSTTPDIRIITRWPRAQTHFAHLEGEGVGVGVRGLFQAHPQLAGSGGLNGPTQAFLLGYISHLLADEVWIVDVYRPFFGNPRVFPEEVRGNILDRALQLELDRVAREDLNGTLDLGALLAQATQGVQVEFLPRDLLERWRDWLREAFAREFTWDRLRFLARRQYPEGDQVAAAVVARFLAAGQEGLEEIYQRVPREVVAGYHERAVQELVRVAREYLA